MDQLEGGDPPGEQPLSPAEMQVLRLVGRGHTNQEIAVQLGLSRQTIKNHLTAVYRKRHLHRPRELVRLAVLMELGMAACAQRENNVPNAQRTTRSAVPAGGPEDAPTLPYPPPPESGGQRIQLVAHVRDGDRDTEDHLLLDVGELVTDPLRIAEASAAAASGGLVVHGQRLPLFDLRAPAPLSPQPAETTSLPASRGCLLIGSRNGRRLALLID